MHIKLSPQRSDETLALSRQGDTLIINGESYDFSVLEPGDSYPGDALPWPFAGDVERGLDGTLQIKLILPHGAQPTQEQAFPQDIIDPADGPIPLPGQEESHD